MVGYTLEQGLNNFVRSMHEQGILDDKFDYVRSLQDDEHPVFVTETIMLFKWDAEKAIMDMHKCLFIEPSMDFFKLEGTTNQLRMASVSIGACRLVIACCQLNLACYDLDKPGCCRCFTKVVDDYNTLCANLAHIIDLERQVRAFKRNHPRRRD